MASWNEWHEYFVKKNPIYLKKQLKLIRIADRLDEKIKSEFQLNYLKGAGDIIERILQTPKIRRSH